MYIGEFCKQTRTTPKTIRFYESMGLLPPAKRRGRYRVYDDTYVETVRQIKQAQTFGFTLAELKVMFVGVDIRRGQPAEVIRRAIQEKRRAIAEQVAELERRDSELVDLERFLDRYGCELDSDPKGRV